MRGKTVKVALIVLVVVAVCGVLGVVAYQLQADDKETTTDSGLKYVELKVGTGDAAKKGDRVRVHYTGWLKDGKKFDSSVDRKEPFVFELGAGEVIKGWDEGIAGIKPGGKRKLTIPSKLAYGKKGFGNGVIPPDADLTFEVELLKILPILKPTDTSKAKVITTASGLKYVDLAEGKGAAAKKGDTLVVHYTGWLQKNGKQFDSSLDVGDPIDFEVGAGKVIKGWDEGLIGMKAGSKRQLIIPSDLAYGDKGNDAIPSKAVLIFDVELVEIK
jgi:peptidylprolyl isomerase